MGKRKKVKVVGEGGAHAHTNEDPTKTMNDGIHKHLYMIGDRLIMTQLDGAHWHRNQLDKNITGPEEIKHKHRVKINTEDGVQEFETGEAGPHPHELQTNGTTTSGLHQHPLDIGGEKHMSLLPSDLITEIERATKQVPAFKDFKVRKSEDPMEIDFQLIKRLNQSDFRDILKKSVERAQLKSLSTLRDGFQIESLILSRERFSDIGMARRYVMDNGIKVSASEEIPEEGVFTFQVRSRDRFEDSTLMRVRISDGVEAVVGLLSEETKSEEFDEEQMEVTEGSGADGFTENATEPEPEPSEAGSLSDFSDPMKSKFDKVRSLYGLKKEEQVTKARSPKRKFTFLRTGKELQGSVADQLEKIAHNHGIERKFVTVEFPQKKFLDVLTDEDRFEIVSAAYSDLSEDESGTRPRYESLHVKSENLDAFVVTAGGMEGGSKNLVIFFDDPDKLDDIFRTDKKNYEYGTYEFRMTMCGPTLVPVDDTGTKVEPILDEELYRKLKNDTDIFFSPESEDFFNGQNPAKVKMDYKRGVFLYGPPGNGKTTFIKYFSKTVPDAYKVICSPSDFSGCMGEFLKNTLGKHEKKVIVFEDIDAIAENRIMRSELLNFLDGIGGPNYKSLFIATTNYPERLDEALTKRPSRFDQKYYVGLPDQKMRAKFLKTFFKNKGSKEIARATKKTEGFSGAMFEELFKLTGLQKLDLDSAIKRMQDQMGIHKSNGVNFEEIEDILFTDKARHTDEERRRRRRRNNKEDEVSKQVPDADASNEEKRQAQRKRSEEFGITALDNGTESLTFPADGPEELELYADPVNLKFPMDTAGRTRNAIARFPQAKGYSDNDQGNIADRIAERALELDITISQDAGIWEFMSSELRNKHEEAASEEQETEQVLSPLKQKMERLAPLYGIQINQKSQAVEISKRASLPKSSFVFDIVKRNDEKRLVTGPVLVPDKVDLQGDIISKEDIEVAIHNYMIKLAFQNDEEFLKQLGLNTKSERGFMHTEFSRKIAFVEMFIAPLEMTLNQRQITEGTAISTAKVFDDEVWSLVKARRITGFSIGGRSKVVPLE